MAKNKSLISGKFRFKPDLVGILKIWAGQVIFLMTGGVGLVVLGLLPTGAIIALAGLVTAGVLSAASLATITALGTIYLLVAVPATIYAAALLDSGIKAVFNMSFGIQSIVKRGADRIPVVGKLIGVTIE